MNPTIIGVGLLVTLSVIMFLIIWFNWIRLAKTLGSVFNRIFFPLMFIVLVFVYAAIFLDPCLKTHQYTYITILQFWVPVAFIGGCFSFQVLEV